MPTAGCAYAIRTIIVLLGTYSEMRSRVGVRNRVSEENLSWETKDI
ncbi:MAG: hypothetical protein WBL95_02550 [Microcoleus sp.]